MHGYEELNAKINRLKNGGGMGYSDTKTLCYDGKQMGTDVLEDGNLYVKVSADPLNLDGFQSVTLSSKSGGSLSYGKSQVAIGTEDGITAVAIDHLTYLLAFVVADENVGIEVGTYFYSGEDTYVSAIKTETIHPISHKYLPEGFGGGGLPVVELTTQIDVTGASGSVALSEEDCAALDAVVGKPFAVQFKGTMMDGPAVVCDCPTVGCFEADGLKMYVFRITLLVFTFTFQGGDGQWSVDYTSAD